MPPNALALGLRSSSCHTRLHAPSSAVHTTSSTPVASVAAHARLGLSEARQASLVASAGTRSTPRPARCCTARASAAQATPAAVEDSAAAAAQAESVAAEQAKELQALLRVKISVAASTGRLDLTDLRLTEIPPAVFDIPDLQDLALAGNCLTNLPEAIGQLTQLKRLGLTGNRLTSVPASIGQLAQLEGLWLHGNLLETLPAQIGQLTQLQQLSLAGNRLQELPDAFADLQQLYELACSGNRLASLPPSLGSLGGLKKLLVNGNRLAALPDTLGGLTRLVELSLQGNELRALPPGIGQLKALQELSVADNRLESLPEELAACAALQKVWAYGNRLSHLPASLASAPALASLWLEDNPLQADCVQQLVQAMPKMAKLRHLGLDTQQLAWADAATVAAAGSQLRVGGIIGSGRGYFKLQTSAASPSTAQDLLSRGTSGSAAAVMESAAAPTGGAATTRTLPPLLVVAFGSAPGLPNWGEVLGRQQRQAPQDSHRAYDVLFVVDPERAWYQGGNPVGLAHYTGRMRLYTQRYSRVLMLGDSMGATATLLFAPLATAVMAFCPQVDMDTASIRPGNDADWMLAMKAAMMDAVSRSQADITVLSGTWKHDLDQVNMLPADRIKSKVFSIDSHRLAAYLDSSKKLVPLVEAAILQQLGIKVAVGGVDNKGGVRLHNLL